MPRFGKKMTRDEIRARVSLNESTLLRTEDALKHQLKKREEKAKECLKSGDERGYQVASRRWAVVQGQLNAVSPMIELAENMKGTLDAQETFKGILLAGEDIMRQQKELGLDEGKIKEASVKIAASMERARMAFDAVAHMAETLTISSPELSEQQEMLRAKLMKEIELEKAGTAELEEKIKRAEKM